MLKGALVVEGAAVPPRLALEAAVADAIISGPLFELPIDLGAGRVEGTAKLTSAGHSMAAILATLAGEAGVVVRDGVLIGFDRAVLQAAGGITELRPAEAALARPSPAARPPSSGWKAVRCWPRGGPRWRGRGWKPRAAARRWRAGRSTSAAGRWICGWRRSRCRRRRRWGCG